MAGDAAVNVGDVESVLRLRDEFSDIAGKFMSTLNAIIPGLEGLGVATGLVTAAVGAAVGAIVALGEHGARVDDTTEAFKQFAGSASNAADILQHMRDGVKGTVNDYELMQNANKVLASGVHLTGEEFGVLSTASRDLAKQGFGTTTENMSQLSLAMETGRLRGELVKQLHVDLKDATQKYADSIGVTVDSLSAEQKAHAGAIELMAALRARTKEAGDMQLDFGERIEQGKIALQNFGNALSVSVATSPVILTALKSIGTAMQDAFGGDQVQLVQTLTQWINKIAIWIADFAIAAVDSSHVFIAAWGAIRLAVDGVVSVIANVIAGFANLNASITEFSAKHEKITGVTQQQAIAARTAADVWDAYAKAAHNSAQADLDMITGNSAANAAVDKFAGVLMNVRDNMIAASTETASNADITDKLAGAHAAAGAAVAGHSAQFDAFKKTILDTTEKITEAESHGITMDGVLKLLGSDIKAVSEGAMIWGVTLTGAMKAAVDEFQKRELAEVLSEITIKSQKLADAIGKQLREEATKTADAINKNLLSIVSQYEAAATRTRQMTLDGTALQLDQLQTAYDAEIAKLGLRTDQNALYWDKAKRQIDDFYAYQTNALYVDTAALKANSTDTLQAVANKARATYLAMAANSGDFSAATIAHFKRIADEAQDAATGVSHSFRDAFSNIGTSILSALQGGGNVIKTIGGTVGKDFGDSVLGKEGSGGLLDTFEKKLGPSLGGIVGSVLPGIGTLLGAGLGSLLGSIGGPSKSELAARGSLADFLKTFETKAGDQASAIQPLEDQLLQVGFSAQSAQQMVARLLDAKTPAAYAAALAQIKPAIDANLSTTTAVGQVSTLVSAFTSAGHVIPQSLRDALTTLSTMKGLTADEAAQIKALADGSKPNFESLTQEAADLGVSLAALGPKFEQGDLEQKTSDLVGKVKDLTAAGGDLGGILAGSAAKFGDLAQESIQFGTKLPESIRPYIQNLIDSNALVDSAGNKITDMTKLQFEATPLSEGLDNVNASIDHLADVLDKLPGKFAAVGSAAASMPTPNLGGAGAGASVPTFGPEVFVPSPRMAVVGTNGGEVVLHKSTYDAMQGGGGGNSDQVVAELRRLNAQMQLMPGTIIRGQRDAALIANA